MLEAMVRLPEYVCRPALVAEEESACTVPPASDSAATRVAIRFFIIECSCPLPTIASEGCSAFGMATDASPQRHRRSRGALPAYSYLPVERVATSVASLPCMRNKSDVAEEGGRHQDAGPARGPFD